MMVVGSGDEGNWCWKLPFLIPCQIDTTFSTIIRMWYRQPQGVSDTIFQKEKWVKKWISILNIGFDMKLTSCFLQCSYYIYLISATGGPFLVMEFSTYLARRDQIILKINLRQCSSKRMLVLWSPRWPLVGFSIHSKSLKLLIQLHQFFTNFQNHKGALDKTSGLLRWDPHCWICEVLKCAEFFNSLSESVQILVCLIWSLLVVDVLYWFFITKLMSCPSMT